MADSFFDLIVISSLNRIIKIINTEILLRKTTKSLIIHFRHLECVVVTEVTGHTG